MAFASLFIKRQAISIFGVLAFTCIPHAAIADNQSKNLSIQRALDAAMLPATQNARLRHRYILFATNRRIDRQVEERARGGRGPSIRYDQLFQNLPDVSLAYGWARISIPSQRSVGQQNYSSDSSEQNPLFTFSISDHYIASSPNELAAVVAKLPFGKNARPLLYVHGLDNSFNDAAERLTQVSVDVQLSGVPILFSWPSDNIRMYPATPLVGLTPSTYLRTGTIATMSTPYLRQTITDLVEKVSVEFDVLAHSMGTLIATKTLAARSLSARRSETRSHPRLVLAAPDIAVGDFRGMRPDLVSKLRRVTVYCSDDLALSFSRRVNNSDSRVGSCKEKKEEKDLMEGIEFVRISGRTYDFPNHSYFINTPILLQDMRRILGDDSMGPFQRYRELAPE